MSDEKIDSAQEALAQEKNVFGYGQKRWTDEEMKKLREIAAAPCRQEDLRQLFPERTQNAIRKRIGQIRRESTTTVVNRLNERMDSSMLSPNDPGLGTTERRDWRKLAIASNVAYLAALKRTGHL